MPEEPFLPLNDLEVAVLKAMRGELQTRTMLELFLRSRIAIPSATVVERDMNDMQPVYYDRQGTLMLAVFTDLERAKRVGDMARYCLVLDGKNLIARLAPGRGIVVNPGFRAGFEISPEGLNEIRKEVFGGDVQQCSQGRIVSSEGAAANSLGRKP